VKTRILFSLGILALTACGGSNVRVVEDSTPQGQVYPIDSLSLQVFSAQQDTVLAPLVAHWPEPARLDPQPQTTLDPDADQTLMIYRIQLFTTKELAKATAVRDEAVVDFGEEVRVDFETPYYKVRVGAYATAREAEPLLNEARRLGYRGAWAVRVRAPDDSD
jgi:hypothetical protein